MSSEWKDRECEVKDNSPWDLIQDRGGKNSQKSMCREVLTLNGKLRVLQPYQVFGVAIGQITPSFSSSSPCLHTFYLSQTSSLLIFTAPPRHIFFSPPSQSLSAHSVRKVRKTKHSLEASSPQILSSARWRPHSRTQYLYFC